MSYLPDGPYSYQTVTTTPTPILVVNKVAYVCKGVSLLTFTLPVTSLMGFSFKIVGQSCLWKLIQNANQTISVGKSNTTIGIAGSISSTYINDKIEITCFTLNTGFDATDSFGNIITI